MAYDFTKMRNILSDWNLELTAEKEQQFLTFYEMLVEKNKVMNLTAITEFEDVVEKHFLDSGLKEAAYFVGFGNRSRFSRNPT